MIAEQVAWNPMASMDDVVAAYRLFLRREPEPRGLEHYEKYVNEGMPLERLAEAFLSSAEFSRLQPSGLAIIDLGGYEVCVDPHETDIARFIVLNNDYEPHVRRAVAERLKEGQTFVDLGANVGCISFQAAKA